MYEYKSHTTNTMSCGYNKHECKCECECYSFIRLQFKSYPSVGDTTQVTNEINNIAIQFKIRYLKLNQIERPNI